MRAVGATGFPSSVLVNPEGEIVFQGHPSKVDGELVRSALGGALAKPLFEWPKELKSAVKAYRKGDLGKAIKAARDEGEEFAEYATMLEGVLEHHVAEIKAADEAGDYLKAVTVADRYGDAIEGHGEAAAIETILDGIKSDRAKKDVLDAQKAIAKMFEKDIKERQIPGLVKKLEKLREEHPGTIVERDVTRGLARLQGK